MEFNICPKCWLQVHSPKQIYNDYDFECENCDEDFYEIETIVIKDKDIRCNLCMEYMTDDNLILLPDWHLFYKACPNCKCDSWLIDLS